ncbi:CHKov1 [Anopheles darlingi]|uniref:CHKov1 n=1 Tax=Anopheles darlingi TaxID=43151 RepID=W5J8G5_ANODA|nr:CHKov1 [Anopheles darlingi]
MESSGWQCVEYFQEILERELQLQDGIGFTVRRLQVGSATEKTAGYMSLMHRVSIDLEVGPMRQPRTLCYIVKEKSDTVFGGDLVDVLAVFPKERNVYETLLPTFEGLWSAQRVQFGPRMLKATESAQFTVIVMEDLTVRGYRMRDRCFNLPMADVKGVLSKMAKFHAASAVYRAKGGNISEHFMKGVISENTLDLLESYYELLFNSFLESMEKRHFPIKYLNPLTKLKGRLLSECCKLNAVDETEFNVFNHGDLWPNNIMFNESDLLFLDFQTVVYGSFAQDLLYFFVTTGAELICEAFDELVDFYYESLTSSMETLGYSQLLPSYAELMSQLQRRGVLVLPPLSEALGISMAELSETLDMVQVTTDSLEGTALREKIYSNPAYVSLVDRLIPVLFEKGLFRGLDNMS